MKERIDACIDSLVDRLLDEQQEDGAWRYRFVESGMMTDCHFVVMISLLGITGRAEEVRKLAKRIRGRQDQDGAWRVYPDEKEGNISATIEGVLALFHAGDSLDAPHMRQALHAIERLGGAKRVNSLMTKFLLALAGYKSWPAFFPIPLALLLLPQSSPLHFFRFSGYARVHMAPMLVLGERKPRFANPNVPQLESLKGSRWLFASTSADDGAIDESWSAHLPRGPLDTLQEWASAWIHAPKMLKQRALDKAESYMRERIEADGTLYSYASSTIFMVYALVSLGYDQDDPLIRQAIDGLVTFFVPDGHGHHLQTTTSTVWDTALISHALQDAGVGHTHPAIMKAGRYVLGKQHNRVGDWALEAEHDIPGGWGFSHINTINPDIDDTTASLRAIEPLRGTIHEAGDAADRGLNWLLGMQNSDGGWGAFERNNNHPLIKWIPLEGADAAATDPSCADLTGRALEYLGNTAGFTNQLPFVQRAVQWLHNDQKPDGPWYGRWGVCFIYGTWAALTGLAAVGEKHDHPAIRKAVQWLLKIQRPDGGFGESCSSDIAMAYEPLNHSTIVQTAWALDALTAVHDKPNEAIMRATEWIVANQGRPSAHADYPTGAALPGHVYSRYESYPIHWPLLALSHARRKFGKLFPEILENDA
ncbi:terpene cyclase/mutase family protein [Paenibacillus aurantiacus]